MPMRVCQLEAEHQCTYLATGTIVVGDESEELLGRFDTEDPLPEISRALPMGRGSQVVRRRFAKPLSAVRFRPAPPQMSKRLSASAFK